MFMYNLARLLCIVLVVCIVTNYICLDNKLEGQKFILGGLMQVFGSVDFHSNWTILLSLWKEKFDVPATVTTKINF